MAEPSIARVVILAAGKGSRMRSRLPKALHKVGGLPMIEHALRGAGAVSSAPPLVVAGPDQEPLLEYLRGRAEVAFQPSPQGTADALLRARPALPPEGLVMVLPADLPLLTGRSLGRLAAALQAEAAAAAVLTLETAEASGFGRVKRDGEGRFSAIVEDADEPWDGLPAEVNVGAYLFRQPQLWEAVGALGSDNAQRERYLSWVPQLISGGALTIALEDPREALQVNDRVQLAAAELGLRQRKLLALMRAGVTVVDPGSTWVDCDVEVGEDTTLHPGTVLRGRTSVGGGCEIGPFAELQDVVVGEDCRIGRAHLVACKLASGVDIGPFNRVRAGSEFERNSHLGTFTEVVRSRVGEGTQIPHLSYIGDSELGRDVNIGAGSITANWDGEEKHHTVIEDGVRLGSDTILVAPITVGREAYTGAGSVLTQDVPPGALGVARARQRNIEGYRSRRQSRRPDQDSPA